MEIITFSEARDAANRAVALNHIMSAMRAAQIDARLTDEDRNSIRLAADDLADEIGGTIAELTDAFGRWEMVNDYGSPDSPAADSADYHRRVL